MHFIEISMKQVMKQIWRVGWMVGAAFFCLAGRSEGATFVTFPSSWDVGQPFAVSIESDKEYKDPALIWLGRTISLDVEPIRAPKPKDGKEPAAPRGFISYGLLGTFVRDAKTGKHPLVFEFVQDEKRFHVTGKVDIRPRKYPEEKLEVSPKMVFPNKKELPRIRKETALAGRAKRTMTVKRHWTTPAQPPLRNLHITSSYGFRRIYNGTPRGCHAGTDFRAAVGNAVQAPFAGKVILTGDHYYAGKSVYVDSGNGVLTVFFHLSEILVKQGQWVKKGQVLARSGATGRITGPHLHYGLCLAGQYVDGMALFESSVTALLNRGQKEKVAD